MTYHMIPRVHHGLYPRVPVPLKTSPRTSKSDKNWRRYAQNSILTISPPIPVRFGCSWARFQRHGYARVQPVVNPNDPSPTLVTRDLTRDYIQSRDPTQSHDPMRFGHAICLLTGTWKTVGINQRSMRSQGIPHSLSPMDTGTGNAFTSLRA